MNSSNVSQQQSSSLENWRSLKQQESSWDSYFAHLQSISLLGRLYKRYVSAPFLYGCARSFGPKILEVGCGIGAGVLGAFPSTVSGVDINPAAVKHCVSQGLDAKLISADLAWDIADESFDACVLDNVLEHILDSSLLLQEIARVTSRRGGLVVAVPGSKGYASDTDHKIYYNEHALQEIGHGWKCDRLTALPVWIGRHILCKTMRQFCFVAVYSKKPRLVSG